ncbi:MAG TPA: copper resistance CopC family protein [Kofleriaceae bacterium]|nr:copper resistance CopC family protein [Kofleriaceae bacterium]
MRAILVVAIAGWLAGSSVAFAHAKLERSTPVSGAVLDRAPTQVMLQFDSDVERRFSRFTLRLPGGEKRALAAPNANGRTRELSVPLGALAAGDYALEWSVVSRDGHRVSGTLRFTVRPG